MDEQNESPKPRNPRAFNAYRHGLTGQIHILTEKDQLAYEKHCAGIRESLAPQTPLEASIVQSIADDRWRLHRAASFEDTLFAELRRLKAEREAALQQALKDAEIDAQIAEYKGEPYEPQDEFRQQFFVFSKPEIVTRVTANLRRKQATQELVDLRYAQVA